MTRQAAPVPAAAAALATLRIRGLDPLPADVAAAWGAWEHGDDMTEADAVREFCAAWESGTLSGIQGDDDGMD